MGTLILGIFNTLVGSFNILLSFAVSSITWSLIHGFLGGVCLYIGISDILRYYEPKKVRVKQEVKRDEDDIDYEF